VWLVSASARLVLRPLGVRPGDGLVPAVTEDQILLQVEAGEQQGTVEADEKEMIENVFELNDLTAADVMVHRKDVVALPAEASWEEIRDTIRRAGVSRIPIYRGSIDTIEGVLNARDFLLRSVDSRSFAIAALLRKPMFVPETVKADVLLKRMQKRKQSIAIIVDDYGGTSGIVTIEDLVEQIVGDLYDEYDGPDDVVEIKDLGEGKWLVPGESSIDDVNEALGTELAEGEFSTLAGWIVERLASVPAQGADVDVPELGLSMKVVKMEGRRIDTVLVRKTAAPAPKEAENG
jgi:putative hemolysin